MINTSHSAFCTWIRPGRDRHLAQIIRKSQDFPGQELSMH